MEEKAEPKIFLFFCANCLSREEVDNYSSQLKIDKRMIISIPCSGKVDIPYLVKAFETGVEGVVVLTCQMGDCKHLEGNKRAKKRAMAVDSLMDEIGIGTGRIVVLEVKQNDHEQAIALVRNFIKTVQHIPTGGCVKALT